MKEFKFDDSQWMDVPKKSREKEEIKPIEWENDGSKTIGTNGYNIAIPGYEWKGKTLLATLFGFLNSKYFDKMGIKEKFPKSYEMIHSGLVPEVEEIQVLDLDASYRTLSHSGIFYKLVKPLYDENKIKRKTIKIPKRQQNFLNNEIREVALMDIDKTKIRIENEITIATRDNGPEVLFIIDSMSSYDELLNDKFRILFENVIAAEEERGLATSLKGIRQNYWMIRNAWWIETLRDKRNYRGWQIDTYKITPKSDLWLEKEAKTKNKSIEELENYTIHWAPKTKYEMDFILMVDNDKEHYWCNVESRFEGNIPQNKRVYYTPNRRYAAFEILEELAPAIMGEVDGKELTQEELWGKI
ncbi:MAG: hypothetical protein ACTSQY_00360 [Candidatus Odinarchaeia archaeon]|nr:MAG: hypothetical protein [Lokiarchaeota virus Fenrir Meg22_1012]URC17253.1 MAG: hypothetical protein [Lokiarchaeota virus Fenrir Meg22_1214]